MNADDNVDRGENSTDDGKNIKRPHNSIIIKTIVTTSISNQEISVIEEPPCKKLKLENIVEFNSAQKTIQNEIHIAEVGRVSLVYCSTPKIDEPASQGVPLLDENDIRRPPSISIPAHGNNDDSSLQAKKIVSTEEPKSLKSVIDNKSIEDMNMEPGPSTKNPSTSKDLSNRNLPKVFQKTLQKIQSGVSRISSLKALIKRKQRIDGHQTRSSGLAASNTQEKEQMSVSRGPVPESVNIPGGRTQLSARERWVSGNDRDTQISSGSELNESNIIYLLNKFEESTKGSLTDMDFNVRSFLADITDVVNASCQTATLEIINNVSQQIENQITAIVENIDTVRDKAGTEEEKK